MHTSSYADVSDMYIEKITKKDGRLYYEYDGAEKPVIEKQMTLRYKSGDSTLARTVTTYFTGHGPIMAKRNGQWLSVRSYNRALKSLIQSWERTKATGFESFKKIMDLRANTSNNTVFADDKGNIAYWHGDFMPRRDPKLDWSQPVDGSTSATEWKGLHPVSEIVHMYNPSTGWIQNCNSTPFTCSGSSSPKRSDYPAYMAPDGQNFRGINAARILSKATGVTIEKLTKLGYDPTLTAFEILVPALVKRFESDIKPGDSLYTQLSGPISVLKQWNDQCDAQSVATTLAVSWGYRILRPIFQTKVENGEDDQVGKTKQFAATASTNDLVLPFYDSVKELEQDFGTWKVAWGDINRYQRINDDLDEQFYDDKPSLPVGYASSAWGMLAAFNSRKFPGTRKFYGVSGASFICAIEFGKKVKAKSLLTGGESGDPASKHFFDQGKMYTTGQFKDVYFYKNDVMKHKEEEYHPGERKKTGM